MRDAKETDLVRACLELLRLRGVVAWRQNCGAMRQGKRFIRFTSAKGISDIVGCFMCGCGCGHARMLCVEVKKPGGRLTKEQGWFLDRVREAGGLALCVSDAAQLDEALRREGVG